MKKAQVPVRCIINHHTLGYVPNTAELVEWGIPVIEDISLSYGTNVGELKAGALGALTLLGLEARDVLTAGGGAILYASNKREASVLRQFAELPPEYRLPDMNAAMAAVQFKEHEKTINGKGNSRGFSAIRFANNGINGLSSLMWQNIITIPFLLFCRPV